MGQRWEEVTSSEGSNNKAEAYQGLVDTAIAECFPLITVCRKTTDLPWVNAKARRLIRRRKAIYRKEGRSDAWKRLQQILVKQAAEPPQESLSGKPEDLPPCRGRGAALLEEL